MSQYLVVHGSRGGLAQYVRHRGDHAATTLQDAACHVRSTENTLDPLQSRGRSAVCAYAVELAFEMPCGMRWTPSR